MPQSRPQEREIARSRKRFDALVKDGPISRWRTDFEGQPLANLLAEFTGFAYKYFDYVVETYPKKPKATLSHDLNTALGSLQHEWAVISRACEQREIPEFKLLLAQADTCAKIYYSRFSGHKILHADPIIYLDKLYVITRYAFTPYPLISIPLYVFNEPKEWLALAHELGHFVFWNSIKLLELTEVHARLKKVVLESLNDLVLAKLRDLSDSLSVETFDYHQKQSQVMGICMNWMEETFADVYGTLVAGPAFVISGQRRTQETASTFAQLVADDELHPVPYLRPLIGLETLKWVARQLKDKDGGEKVKGLEDVITRIEESWQQLRGTNWRRMHRNTGLRMKVIEDAIPVVVGAILEGSKNSGGAKSWVGVNGEAKNLGELVDYEPWLEDLSEVMAALDADRVPDLSSVLEHSAEPVSSFEIKDQDRAKFDELTQYLAGAYKKDEVREILLSLELGRSHSAVCSQKWVKYVGWHKGNYRRCNP